MFIDIDQPEYTDSDDSQWSDLPDLLLEKIYLLLTIKERYYASLVCKNWNKAFYLPNVWSRFVLDDYTLTRSKFNYYLGWQYVLDHLRTSLCLSAVGKHVKSLIIRPMLNFTNLYDFLNILSWYSEQQVQKDNVVLGIGSNIRYLKFTFPCNMTARDDDEERIRLFGTGGKLLDALKRLMKNLRQLQTIELIDLMLEPNEAQFLLDDVCQTRYLSFRKIALINATKVPYQILHVGVFLNLLELHISPQNLGDDLVELLGFTKLKHLHIIQNRYTIDEGFISKVTPSVWRRVKKMNECLNVHLEVESKKHKSLVWQEGAPVRTILYNSPHIGITADTLLSAIDYFKNDLKNYGHLNIPRFHMSKSFNDRNDANLIMLTRSCRHLSTLTKKIYYVVKKSQADIKMDSLKSLNLNPLGANLNMKILRESTNFPEDQQSLQDEQLDYVITEKISTSSVLLISHTGRNLKRLHVRKNAVILKFDWPRSPEWSDEFYYWIKMNSRSYELTENEVSKIFGYKWRFLTDKEFKKLEVNLHEF